jgi:betaine-homocysteine S-methyltransferase
VVEAFTYYAHRDKVRIIDKEEFLEDLNRQALANAKEVALESRALLAGNICSNTNIYDPQDTDSHRHVRSMFEEQVGWAVDADVDYIIGEIFSYASEALLALDVIRESGLPAVITLAVHRAPETREDLTPEAAWRTPAQTWSG